MSKRTLVAIGKNFGPFKDDIPQEVKDMDFTDGKYSLSSDVAQIIHNGTGVKRCGKCGAVIPPGQCVCVNCGESVS